MGLSPFTSAPANRYNLGRPYREGMTTSVRVKTETKELLRMLKEQWNLKSYDAVLMQLIKESKSIGRSEMGRYPRLRQFERD